MTHDPSEHDHELPSISERSYSEWPEREEREREYDDEVREDMRDEVDSDE